MITLNRKNNSKYIIYIGWAGYFYATCKNDISNLIIQYGREKIKIEKLKKGDKQNV